MFSNHSIRPKHDYDSAALQSRDLLIEQWDARNAKQDGWALKWPMWCFDALPLDTHQCQIFFLHFVKMSANILRGWKKNIICISPPNSFSFLTSFPSMTHPCLCGPDWNSWGTNSKTYTAPNNKARGDRDSMGPLHLLLTVVTLMNFELNPIHDGEWQWNMFKGSVEISFFFLRIN